MRVKAGNTQTNDVGVLVVAGAGGVSPTVTETGGDANLTISTDGTLVAQTELFASVSYSFNTVSAASSAPIFIAPFALSVTQFSVITWNSDHTADDTNYWTVVLRRYRANSGADIATKTTQATGGTAITRRTDWNFDALTFSSTNQVLQKGDQAAIVLTPTGAPTAIGGFGCAVRYEPT